MALAALPGRAEITGHWSFESADLFLSAKIGFPVLEIDSETGINTTFGSTGVGAFAGVPNIAGQSVAVMGFPKTTPAGGYFVPHGANANGGGTKVNQYTLIADVLFPSASSGKVRALFQTDGGGNAEFFVNAANQIGADGMPFAGNLTPDVWHRVAFAVDLSASPRTIAYFIDGVKVFEGSPVGSQADILDGRFALIVPQVTYSFLYFANDDDGQTEAGYVNSIQVRDTREPDGVLSALGAPTPTGILTGPLPDPYLASITPSPESLRIPERSTVSPLPLIQAVIVDGTNGVNEAQITMQVNGVAVTPTITVEGVSNIVSYTPTALLASFSTNSVRIDYRGADGAPYTAQWQFFVGRYSALAAAAAAPSGSGLSPGFGVRTAQAPPDTGILNVNTLGRAIRQLNGTLVDTGSVVVANVAVPGPNANGGYSEALINYNFDVSRSPFGNFESDAAFPGIPGAGAAGDLFATEVVTWLELPAGSHRLGVSVSVDRTDNGTDDGFVLLAGSDARSVLAPVMGSFSRNVANPFASTYNNNEFNVVAPVAGLYSFRLVHWQTFQNASLEFYSVVAGTTNKVMINDGAPGAIRAYQTSTAAFANKPYISQISPAPGSSGVSPALPVEVLIQDDQTQVNPNSVQLLLNNVAVPRVVSKSGARTTVSYQPNVTRTDVTNRWRLIYADSAARSYTNDWSFTIQVAAAGGAPVAGQWDFNFGDLSATVGQALEFLDGAGGQTATLTQFGTTTGFGIPDIGGVPATVMKVPGNTGPGSDRLGYIMRHGIPANGGGQRVNQYTLIMDLYWDAVPPGFASFLNCDLSNTSDGDFFYRVADGGFGQGTGGYEGYTRMELQKWHRVVFAVDMGANPPVVTKFLDGYKHADQLAPNNALDGPRRALEVAGAVLFGDGDRDERGTVYVNSVQVRAGKLSDGEVASLGGPSATGIPVALPQTTVRGQWDFERGTLAPTVGQPLEYFDGPAGTTAAGTQFGTTTSFGIPDIDGVPATVMKVPGNTGAGADQLGYIMRHGIGANGGGQRVNQYTLTMDLYWDAVPPGFASFLNCDLSNTSDGDFFFRVADGGYGQGTGGYEGNTKMLLQRWHRVTFAVDMAANPPVVTKFLDGYKHADQLAPNNALDGPRRALEVLGAVLFGDGDRDERGTVYVNSVQVRAGKLSDGEIAALGRPSARGIPVAAPATTVTGQWDFENGNLAPTVGRPLEYFDGAAGTTAAGTQFGTTTSFGIPDIGGAPATVMKVPGNTGPGADQLGYIMRHGIGANGGGQRVNQYTLVMDLYWDAVPPGFASFINYDLSNSSDGDFFFRVADGGFGQGTGGYEGNTKMLLQRWHRVAFAVDMAANPPVVTKFLDGVKHADQLAPNNALDGPRRAMEVAGAVLFGDGDRDERGTVYVNSVQVRSGKLSDAELALFGAPSASGVPVSVTLPQTLPVSVRATRVGGVLRLTWPVDATGYILQGSPSLSAPNWQTVPGVTGNSADVPIAGPAQFFRLVKP